MSQNIVAVGAGSCAYVAYVAHVAYVPLGIPEGLGALNALHRHFGQARS